MPNPHPKTEHLPKQHTSWQHLPTKAIRVPAVLSDRLLALAKLLDRHPSTLTNASIETETIASTLVEKLQTLSSDELVALQQALPLILESKSP